MNIIFFGSDDFSLSILKILLDNEYKPVLVLTSPDKPKGRGKKTLPTDVKVLALSNGIEVLTPNKITKDVADKVAEYAPDVFVTVSYGLFLPTSLLKLVEYPLNIHPSLLPKYRGASPIRSAIVNGETKTGVSIMKMAKKMDAGDIYLQKELKIGDDEDYTSIKERLKNLAKDMIISILNDIKSNKAPIPYPQTGEPTFCRKFFKDDLKISWDASQDEIYNKMRAFSDLGLTTFANGQRIKIYSLKKVNISLPAGEVKVVDKKVFVGTKDKALQILKLQFPGKKPINCIDAINGGRFKDVSRFGDG